jgi:hypothetical protein
VVTHGRSYLSALVDGELDHEARDRLLAHLAHCAECRALADAERRVKALLGGMEDPQPSSRLQGALLAIGNGHQGSPDTSWQLPVASQRSTVVPLRSPAVVAAGRFPRRLAAGVAGVAAMAGMAAVGAFVAGEGPVGEGVEPPVQRITVSPVDRPTTVGPSGPESSTGFVDPSLFLRRGAHLAPGPQVGRVVPTDRPVSPTPAASRLPRAEPTGLLR